MRRMEALGVAIGIVLASLPAAGQAPPAIEDLGVEAAVPDGPKPSSNDRSASLAAEAAAARAVALEKLRALSRPAEKGQEPDKADVAKIAERKAVFEARAALLSEWEKVRKSRDALEHPDPTPEAEVAEQRVALDRAKGALAHAANDPASLLPDLFRSPVSQTTEATLAEMKDAIDAAQDAAENLKKDYDALSAAGARKAATPVAAAKAEREEVRKRISALGPRGAEAEAALASAGSADERELARERIVNLLWEGRVEVQRLKVLDARIDLETRRAAARGIRTQVRKARLDLARMTLDRLQAEYRTRIDRRQADVKRASATEGARAERASDPLERYRARRNKEILDQEALCSDLDRELRMPPAVSPERETEKADKAAEDFKRLKGLVESGRSSALVAQRLNNSYRRLDRDRAAIVRNEMAQVLAQLGRYENDLTAVELNQLNDARGDQALRDNLRDSLPETRKAEANAAFAELERKNHEVQEKRRDLLIQLEKRAEETRQQVLRRLRILDEQHAFVRMHLFWVRDSKPLGLSTAEPLRREARDLGRAVLGIVSQPWTRSHLERVSPEFGLAAFGLVALPYLLHRARRALRRRLERRRPVQAVLNL